MGNQICCQETRTHGVLEKHETQIIKHPVIVEPPKPVQEVKVESEIKQPPQEHKVETQTHQQPKETIQIPELSHQVHETLTKKHFFKQEEGKIAHTLTKRYGNDVYVGQLDEYELKPNGLGRMYKPNKSLYIGHFNHGKAQGQGAFIFADGSYYYGRFNNNCADDQTGQYHSQAIHYNGGFRNNNFEGEGIEIGKGYIFEGQFHNGCRTKGTLKWNNDTHIYTGSFNEHNQFHGKGNLKEPQGTYEGDFFNGQKHGKGIYHFAKGSRYEGDYNQGQREGQGSIYHGSGLLAYTGTLKKGLPHGKGSVSKDGKMIEANWVEGIDVNLLPQ